MVSFEIFVKAMPPSLSELKVLPSFCFAFKIPDDMTVTSNEYQRNGTSQVQFLGDRIGTTKCNNTVVDGQKRLR